MARASATSGGPKGTLPAAITTPRLVIRAWRRTDAPLLKSAIDANLDHLKAFMPWARKEPSRLEVVEERIDKFDRRFRADSEWAYAIFSSGEKMLYGAAGIHRSTEKGVLAVGFWLGAGWLKQGFATEAVKALTNVAMKLPGTQRVQIRCDVRNSAAAAVARRSGFAHITTLKNDAFEPGAWPRDTMVWEYPDTGKTNAATSTRKRGLWAAIKSLFGG